MPGQFPNFYKAVQVLDSSLRDLAKSEGITLDFNKTSTFDLNASKKVEYFDIDEFDEEINDKNTVYFTNLLQASAEFTTIMLELTTADKLAGWSLNPKNWFKFGKLIHYLSYMDSDTWVPKIVDERTLQTVIIFNDFVKAILADDALMAVIPDQITNGMIEKPEIIQRRREVYDTQKTSSGSSPVSSVPTSSGTSGMLGSLFKPLKDKLLTAPQIKASLKKLREEYSSMFDELKQSKITTQERQNLYTRINKTLKTKKHLFINPSSLTSKSKYFKEARRHRTQLQRGYLYDRFFGLLKENPAMHEGYGAFNTYFKARNDNGWYYANDMITCFIMFVTFPTLSFLWYTPDYTKRHNYLVRLETATRAFVNADTGDTDAHEKLEKLISEGLTPYKGWFGSEQEPFRPRANEDMNGSSLQSLLRKFKAQLRSIEKPEHQASLANNPAL